MEPIEDPTVLYKFEATVHQHDNGIYQVKIEENVRGQALSSYFYIDGAAMAHARKDIWNIQLERQKIQMDREYRTIEADTIKVPQYWHYAGVLK